MVLNRFLRYLATWSTSQFLIVTVLWVAIVVLGALLTPPARYLWGVYELLEAVGEANIELPVGDLRVLAIVTPIIALGPPLILFPLWRRARRSESPSRAA